MVLPAFGFEAHNLKLVRRRCLGSCPYVASEVTSTRGTHNVKKNRENRLAPASNTISEQGPLSEMIFQA